MVMMTTHYCKIIEKVFLAHRLLISKNMRLLWDQGCHPMKIANQLKYCKIVKLWNSKTFHVWNLKGANFRDHHKHFIPWSFEKKLALSLPSSKRFHILDKGDKQFFKYWLFSSPGDVDAYWMCYWHIFHSFLDAGGFKEQIEDSSYILRSLHWFGIFYMPV